VFLFNHLFKFYIYNKKIHFKMSRATHEYKN